MTPDAYRALLLAARREADERACDLARQDGHEVEQARASGEGNAYSMALAWYDAEHPEAARATVRQLTLMEAS